MAGRGVNPQWKDNWGADNPCWKKGKDCSDRAAGCSATCEKWAEHRKKMEKIYDVRRKRHDEEAVYQSVRKTKGMDQ